MTYTTPQTALPDPVHQAEFYDGVPMRRLMAWVFDTVIIAIVSAIAIPFTFFTALFFFPALMLLVGFIYRVVTLAGSSATPGMRLAGIEFRAADGARLDLGAAALHTLGYTLSWAIAPLQLISVIMMGVTQRSQGLTDMVLGTVAIRRPA